MNGFLMGLGAAIGLAALTYLGLQFGAVTTGARYSAPGVEFEADPPDYSEMQ